MEQVEILFPGAAHLLLTALPGTAAALATANRGVRGTPLLLAIFLAVCAASGLLGFWAFYADPVLGEAFAFFLVFGALALGGYSLWDGSEARRALGALATPLLLWAVGVGFLLMLGYAHGGADPVNAVPSSATRFSHALPGDNTIPSVYAEWFAANGSSGAPPVVLGWHFSDRPPLQTGVALLHQAFDLSVEGPSYEAMGVVLQQLWIVGLWSLLCAARVGRTTRGLVMIAVLLSGVAIVNGFYVWPKLLPTGLLLGAAALLITPLWDDLRRSLWAAGLLAALCALAMLSHGSAVFGMLALLGVAFHRGLPSWRWLGVGAFVAALLITPWLAYQRYADPPGDRLTKWTLAGVVDENDPRDALEAVVDSYREAGIGGTLEYKLENFETMAGVSETAEAFDNAFENGGIEELVRAVRGVSFFYLLPALALFLPAAVAIACGYRRGRERPREWSFALSCLLVFAVGVVVWGLVSFGNLAARTVLHVGSFVLPILAIAGIVAGLRACFPRFGAYYVAFVAAVSLAIYAPVLDPVPGTSYDPAAIAIAVLSLAGFVALAFGFGRGGEPRLPPALGRVRSDELSRAPRPG